MRRFLAILTTVVALAGCGRSYEIERTLQSPVHANGEIATDAEGNPVMAEQTVVANVSSGLSDATVEGLSVEVPLRNAEGEPTGETAKLSLGKMTQEEQATAFMEQMTAFTKTILGEVADQAGGP